MTAASSTSSSTLSAEQQAASERVAAARRFASQYKPREILGYLVHNEFFTPQRSFSRDDICTLRKKLTHYGTFAISSDPKTGLMQTSDTINANMRRQWFTDSVMVSQMQRVLDPASCLKATIVTAAALCTKEVRDAVEHTERDPAWYRDGGLMNGVYHIYLPQSVRVDEGGIPVVEEIRADAEWFNQKRLESQALALMHIVDTILEGTKDNPAAWGLPIEKINTKEGGLLLTAAITMARYLIAANSSPKDRTPDFQTPSASSWEEVPLPDGVTSDAAFTVLGLERLQTLLYSPTANEKLLKARGHFSKNKMPFSAAPKEEKLTAWISSGREFVAARVVSPIERGESPIQNPIRPDDTSLTLSAASSYTFFPEDPVRDASIRYNLVKSCTTRLLGANGMRRYNEYNLHGLKLHDSYLNVLYHMPAIERAVVLQRSGTSRDFGSTDASSVELLQERQLLSDPESAAQWTIGLSASLQALAKAKLSLITAGAKGTPLFASIEETLVDIINRNIAAIPGKLSDYPPLRADGTPLPLYQVMEAYEAIIDLNGERKFIPGAHTLPWSTAQLFDGLRLAEEAAAEAAR